MSIGNDNGNSNTRQLKFISFFNNRSDHAEQLTTRSFLIMLHKSMDQNLGDHNKSNDDSSTKHFRFISFFVKNRLGHFEQLTIILKMIHEVFDR